MRLFSVRSKKLFISVCVIIYCLKIIGLAPFSVQIGIPARINPYASRVQAFSSSQVGLIYNILFLIPATVIPAVCNQMNPWTHEHGNTVTDFLLVIIEIKKALYIFSGCLIILSWTFKQKKAASILNRLLEVDVRFSALRELPFNKQALIFLALHIILNVCLWTSFMVGITIIFKVENLTAELLSRLPEFIVHWFFMEYITVVGLVSRDLETVNKYLLDFKQFGSYLSRPATRNGVLIVSVSNNYTGQVASLKLLCSVRTVLYELCRDIDDFFSFPILFCIAYCFIVIFKQLYTISRAVEHLKPVETVCWTLVFVLKYMYPIVSLTLNVTRTKKEAGLTGQIVHKLLAETITEEIKAELGQFSLQLLHEEVNFTAYGLFTLDSTLLQSMLAGVASYTIILMQFGSSGCKCAEKSAE